MAAAGSPNKNDFSNKFDPAASDPGATFGKDDKQEKRSDAIAKKSALWWVAWAMTFTIVVLVVVVAVRVVRLRVAETLIPRHRWNPRHKAIALETPVVFFTW